MGEVSRSFGLPGVASREGDHLCGFYRGEAERDAILRPYLGEGLRAGDKCFCISDSSTPEDVETTWAAREAPGVERLADFESKLKEFLPRFPQAIWCMYGLTTFSGYVIIAPLKTHPRVLLNGTIFDNPYYVSPAEFLASRS